MAGVAVSALDLNDVQGFIRYGYREMTEACYYLLTVRSAEAARAWCAAAPVSPAVERRPPPEKALHVAFTAPGLRALEVSERAIAGFSAEFLAGMTGEDSRSRRLGDVGESSPANWRWGYGGRIPHVLVMVFANPGRLDAWQREIVGTSAWNAAFDTLACLPTSDMSGREPFNFADGISQPDVDWHGKRKVEGDQLTYTNLVALGEFLLGYPNEYGKYTDRPLLDSSDELAAGLPAAENAPAKKDLGRNGAYLAFRQLEQDVRGFWQFLEKTAGPESLALAELMVGRQLDGTPLLGGAPNAFTYESDPSGLRCPFGAHVRRANPRNTDLPGGPAGLITRTLRQLGFEGTQGFRGDLTASTRFHRILRRGREYGQWLDRGRALQPAPPNESPRGIHFICVNGNIARQFEFVQNAWLMGTKFNGLTEESDPLLGNRQPVGDCPYTGNFSIPQKNGLRRAVTGLPQFITARGGAYFFLPGLRALRYFSRKSEAS
jgi:deferrochelatase/peroxidase EfeB